MANWDPFIDDLDTEGYPSPGPEREYPITLEVASIERGKPSACHCEELPLTSGLYDA